MAWLRRQHKSFLKGTLLTSSRNDVTGGCGGDGDFFVVLCVDAEFSRVVFLQHSATATTAERERSVWVKLHQSLNFVGLRIESLKYGCITAIKYVRKLIKKPMITRAIVAV